MRRIFHVLLVCFASLAGGCGQIGGDGPCEPTAASLDEVVFAGSCTAAACHGSGDAALGLDLQTPGAAQRMVERPSALCDRLLVVPGNPAASFLYEKLASSQPSCGAAMPVGGRLDDPALACVESWIASLPKGCEVCGGGACVDLATSRAHCGACNRACPTGASCAGGSCTCGEGQLECSGACADTQSDPTHCGACDAPCSGTLVCSLGRCKATCDAGLLNCNGACVDATSNDQHCGECNRACGIGFCDAGQCNCGPGIDTQTDPRNCGGCDNVCAPGQTCEMGTCTCAGASLSFAADVQPIFIESCTKAACHRSTNPQADLDLTAGNAYDSLVNIASSQCMDGRKRVLPGDPSESYLIDKLLGVDLCSGTQMPKLDPLAAADIETISMWICAGAPDN